MTNYRRGTALEYAVRDKLRKEGYYVIRSAGSRGAADLVAVSDSHVAFIQCKRRKDEAGAAMDKLTETIPWGPYRTWEVWDMVDGKPHIVAVCVGSLGEDTTEVQK